MMIKRVGHPIIYEGVDARGMRRDRLDDALDGAAVRLDEAAQERGRDGDGEPYIPDGATRIVRGFPYFVIVALLLWVAAVVYLGEYNLPNVIELLCLSFVFCFAILGVPCGLMMSRGLFTGWAVAGLSVTLTAVLWVCGQLIEEFSFSAAVKDMFGVIGIELTPTLGDAVSFLGTLAVVLFTSIGVTSVISAYMRVYMGRVFVSMQDHADRGVRGKAERFFMVPDIVDVKEVVLDPAPSHAFDVGRMASISTYLFILGLLVSSYIFVNPYFLEVMTWKTMLSITLMLSMFTPCLILPWQIVRSVGARVRTDAPRDYYLWQGAKHRLFTTFAALGVFMMMFLLSVYLGNDVERIVMNYLAFLIPLLATSLMYGFLYANNFENADRRIICQRFGEERGSRRHGMSGSSKGGKRRYGHCGRASPMRDD